MKRAFQYSVFALAAFGVFTVPSGVRAADISAEESALVYDLLSPYIEGRKIAIGVDPKIFEQAVTVLKDEKLIGTGRPNFKDKDILDKYGKALF